MENNGSADAIVAGHLCLDIIPELPEIAGPPVPEPGKLRVVGPALISTGGAVSNTGIALHRLGISTLLMGKIGQDTFGHGILDIIRREDPRLADAMIIAEGESSSYTLVFNPPGIDRCFLHCRGANDTFTAEDIDYAQVSNAKLFHFGYPPLMRQMFLDNGAQLQSILERVKASGLTTSLDMAEPDPNSEAGKADWRAILQCCLPFVDIFLPSIDEILFMLDRSRYAQFKQSGDVLELELLDELAAECFSFGAAIVCLKLGDKGLYLRTTSDAARLETMGRGCPATPRPWLNRELLAPCFQVSVVGATGSGDCTIAGFLAALLRGLSPEKTVTRAVAVGACNVEAADATSGVRSWEATEARIREGWGRHTVETLPSSWRLDASEHVYRGPNDRSGD